MGQTQSNRGAVGVALESHRRDARATKRIKSCASAPEREYFQQPMDKFISICAMPIGVLVCFGPGLIFWVMEELKASREDQNDKK